MCFFITVEDVFFFLPLRMCFFFTVEDVFFFTVEDVFIYYFSNTDKFRQTIKITLHGANTLKQRKYYLIKCKF